jgi:hypothetical protein
LLVTHQELVERAEQWLRGSLRCGVVLTERGAGLEIPDAIGWGKYVVVVECKVSRADFFADRKKPHRAYGMGQKRFYLTPPALVDASEVPDGWGLVVAQPRRIQVVRKAPAHVQSRHIACELRLVLSELRRYQLHGITYPSLTLQSPPHTPHTPDTPPIAPH